MFVPADSPSASIIRPLDQLPFRFLGLQYHLHHLAVSVTARCRDPGLPFLCIDAQKQGLNGRRLPRGRFSRKVAQRADGDAGAGALRANRSRRIEIPTSVRHSNRSGNWNIWRIGMHGVDPRLPTGMIASGRASRWTEEMWCTTTQGPLDRPGNGVWNLWVQPVEGGPPRPLTSFI